MHNSSTRIIFVLLIMAGGFSSNASKFIDVKPVNNQIIVARFSDGFNDFPDDATGPSAYYGHPGPSPSEKMVFHGTRLDVTNAQTTSTWIIRSEDDVKYSEGINPTNTYRKSKVSAASRTNQYARDHWIYLVLPTPLQQGKSYTLKINENINTDVSVASFTFDIFSPEAESEAIHINLAGYNPSFTQIKSADIYMFMGDGGHADFSDYEGNDVIAINTITGDKTIVGNVNFWKEADASDVGGRRLIRSPVWNCDLTSLTSIGTYRIAIEGIGCSPEFKAGYDALYDPFKMAVRGYYYMRIGQKDVNGIKPVPRQPLMIPGDESDGHGPTTVYVTKYHPFGNLPGVGGDRWDQAAIWADGKTGEINPNARGGHSDAFDWDRHPGHTFNICDILLPYVLLQGKALNEDDLELAESGDGIPDIIQEAQYEVDFWLSLKVDGGYGSGVTNPINHHGNTYSGVLYQAAPHPVMAWQSAAASAMTAECYRLAGQTALMEYYRDKAVEAYNFLGNNDGFTTQLWAENGERMSGKDLKFTAAAYLYNVTGDRAYEDEMKNLCVQANNPDAVLHNIATANPYNQLYGAIAYMLTNRDVHYPDLQQHMIASIINQANTTNINNDKPSRRTTVEAAGWGYWQSAQNMQRAMVAHAVTQNSSEKDAFLKAMILEADWSMGRNPMNKIQMTGPPGTHYLENTYTTGHNDGTPGIHYGHTPYMMHGDDCWWSNSTHADGASGCADWYTTKGYPDWNSWPYAEGHWNSRYLCPVGEFTPRQTMKGKTALYAYLHGLCSPCDVKYTIHSTSENGTISPSGGTYCRGTVISLTATASTGYKFVAWEGDVSGSNNPVTIEMDGDKNITAIFDSVPTYTLSALATNGEVKLNPRGGIYNQGTLVTVIPLADEGFVFTSWSGDMSGSDNPITITIDTNKTITANFEDITIETCGEILNTDFEAGLVNWINHGNSSIVSDARSGLRALMCGPGIGGVEYAESIPVDNYISSELSFYAKASGSPNASIGIDFLDINGEVIGESIINKFSLSYTSGHKSSPIPEATDKLRLRISKSGFAGTLYVDDICLKLSYEPSSVNKINSGFFYVQNPVMERKIELFTQKDGMICVYNMFGKKIFMKEVITGNNTLELNSIQNGMFILEYISGDLRETGKLIML